MKNFSKISSGLLIISIFFILNGCATIIHGTTQDIRVVTDPSGAEIVVDGNERYRSPASINLKRKTDHIMEITKEGYQRETVNIKSVLSGAVAGNILAGGLIGWGVDAASGGDSRLVPETVDIRLRPVATSHQKQSPTERDLSIEEKLTQIKRLKDKGAITEDEYNKMRNEILSGASRSKLITTPTSSSQTPTGSKSDINPDFPKEKLKE